MEGMMGMRGIRVLMMGIRLEMRGIRVGMRGIRVGMVGISVGMRGIKVGMRGINWNRKNKIKVYKIQFSFSPISLFIQIPDSPHFHPDSPHSNPDSHHCQPDSPHSHTDSPHSHHSLHSGPDFPFRLLQIASWNRVIWERIPISYYK